jgi:hypothetical protein
VAKQLTWTNDGLSTTDGRYAVGVVYGTDGTPVHYFWNACPKLKVKVVGERDVDGTTVIDHEVVDDDRPHGCDTLEEMHAQADAMNRSPQALAKFEAPRIARREAVKAQRRQELDDAKADALVTRLLEHPGFAEKLAKRVR